MSYKVYQSADGRAFIRSKEDQFAASYKKGVWTDRIAFSGNELEELSLISDEKTANNLIQQAKQAVGQKQKAKAV